MTIYTLYVKTHRKTGLKYLGQTSKDPFKYKGSGKDWLPHLKEFGDDVHTDIILQTTDRSHRNNLGRYYSNLWHIVTSSDDFGNKIWANRIPETGGGGDPEMISRKLKGKKKPPRTKEHSEKIASARRGKSNTKTSNGLKDWYATSPDRTNTVKKQSDSLKKWYSENQDKSNKKSETSCITKTMNDYDRLSKVYQMILNGYKNIEIQSQVKIDYATIKKLRDGNHRFFSIFIESK
jgi:hypothetical protein